MLSVSGLVASYSGIQALRGVDLKVEAGQMVALVGPNGAGKSTLLNCLSGIVKPVDGTIQFDGETVTARAPYRVARSGMLQVPEGRQILADLSVLENLQLGVLALGGRQPTYDLDKVYALFPVLRERKDQRAGSLSGGEQQMLAIGRALMGAPKLLLLDEPSLGLSPLMTNTVFAALSELNASGLTILLVEQNARRAFSATHRAYVLEQGRIAIEGDSRELVHEPRVIEHYLGQDPGTPSSAPLENNETKPGGQT